MRPNPSFYAKAESQSDPVAAVPDPGRAFRDEFTEQLPHVRAFARFLCKNDRAQADDLAQAALLRAWAARQSYAMGTNMRAWLFRIVRNCYFSERRRAWRSASFDECAGERSLSQPAPQPAAIELDEVRRALALVPDEQREALILAAAAGMTYEDIAHVTGCALGTVKSRINRGRAALVAAIEHGRPPCSVVPADRACDALAAQARLALAKRVR